MLCMKPNEQGKINLLSLNNPFKSYTFFCIIILAGSTFIGCAKYGNPIGHTNADYTKLPVKTVEEVAHRLEEETRKGNRTPDLAPHNSFKIDSPEIKQAMRSRAARAQLVIDLLDTGHMYEKRNGKIAIIRTKAYKNSGTSETRDRDALVVISENSDRSIIYQSLQKINTLNPAERSAIVEIFFKTRIQLMQPGHRYEGAEGEIITIQ